MTQQTEREVTLQDISHIESVQFRPLKEKMETSGFSFDDLEDYRDNLLADPLDERAFQEALAKDIILNPWQFCIEFPQRMNIGDEIAVFMLPDQAERDAKGRSKDSRYRHGYELPLLLVRGRLTAETSTRLEAVLKSVVSICRFDCLRNEALSHALLYLVYRLLLYAEYWLERLDGPSVFSLRTYHDCGFSAGKLQALQSMTVAERIELEREYGRPFFKLEHIPAFWDDYKDFFIDDARQTQQEGDSIVLYRTIPPQGCSLQEIRDEQQKFGRVRTKPFVSVPWTQARLAAKLEPYFRRVRDLPSEQFEEYLEGAIDRLSESEDIYEFRKIREYWTLRFEGAVGRFKDTLGFRYIHELLKKPKVQISVIDLEIMIKGYYPGRSSDTLGTIDEAGLRLIRESKLDEYGTGRENEVIGRRKLDRLKALISQLHEAKANNDMSKAEAIEREIETLYSELTKNGNTGKVPSWIDKKRKAVCSRIRDGLNRIEKEDGGAGQHLRNSLKLGCYCCYDPERPPEWVL